MVFHRSSFREKALPQNAKAEQISLWPRSALWQIYFAVLICVNPRLICFESCISVIWTCPPPADLFRSLSAFGGLGFRYSCFCPSRQASRLVRQFFWRIYPPKAESTHQLTNSLINQFTIFLCVFVPSWQKTTVLICVNPRLKNLTLNIVHKYIRIYLYTFSRHPGLTPEEIKIVEESV